MERGLTYWFVCDRRICPRLNLHFSRLLCEHSEKHSWKIQSVFGGHIIFMNLTLKSETRFYAFTKTLNSQGFLMSSRLAHVLLRDNFFFLIF